MDKRLEVTAHSSDSSQPPLESEPLVLGLDIGGANIKAADTTGRSHSCQFPLWQQADRLSEKLGQILSSFPAPACFAVTMTGELADCFLDRAEGVKKIVQHCQQALGQRTLFYSVDGAFLCGDDAIALPDHVAASNWHALASLAARLCGDDRLCDAPQPCGHGGLLIDIGSTTCDIIPLLDGQPRTISRTDFDRLKTGELVYLGIGRTPVCSIVDALPFNGHFVPIMNEVFATMDDCAILSGQIDQDAEDRFTCDNRPRTKQFAANRLARMIGLDHRDVTIEQASSMAAYVIQQWRARIKVAIQVLSPPDSTWIFSGHGAKLLELPEDQPCIDLSILLGPEISRAAPAYATARLALEKIAQIDAAPTNT